MNVIVDNGAATYTVAHADGTTNLIRSQRNCRGVWVELGTFNAGTDGTETVTTRDLTPRATAIARFIRLRAER